MTALIGLGALANFYLAWTNRGDTDAAAMWLGMGLFMGSVGVPMATMSLGPRPLRSFGAGACALVLALGAALGWGGRDALDTDARRGYLIAPLMLFLALYLAPYAVWMMIRRPLQYWEQETRSGPTEGESRP